MVFGVVINPSACSPDALLAVGEITAGDDVIRRPLLGDTISDPDELLCARDSHAGFLDDLFAVAGSVVSQFGPVRRSAVSDRRQPVGRIPLKGVRAAVEIYAPDRSAIEIVTVDIGRWGWRKFA